MRHNNEMFELLTDEEILKKAKPHNYVEKIILDNALRILGENTTALKLAEYLNISKANVYKAIDERKIITYKIGRRHIIMTRSILNIIELNKEI